MSLILIKALQLLLCLSLLVVLHEGGHFLFSKLFKVRVEKFYMFFNPKFHLFSTKDKWFAKRFPKIAANETEYGIGWIPLGGYVKIAGMIDESMDKEQMKQPAKPDEFRSQPVWKRFFIMVGGVLMNLITALVIYSCIMLFSGREVMPITNITEGFVYNSEAKKLGFQDGDIPVAVNGERIQYYDATILRAFSDAETITVKRAGNDVTFQVPSEHPDLLDMSEMTPAFLTPYVPAVVDSVLPDGAAAKAGVMKGARLLAVDGNAVDSWRDFDSLMVRKGDKLATCSKADSLALRQMTLVFANVNAAPDTVQLQLNEDYMMGIDKQSYTSLYKTEHLSYNVLSCIPAGCQYGWETLKGYVHDLQYVVKPKGAKSVGSFITIGSIFPDSWDWLRFWQLTALISIILAVMNILPIPGLDGGHVMFLLIEAITRRPLSLRAQTIAEYVGMVLLFALMAWAFWNDIVRFIL
ncbi:MAG: RIP metalloprotease RseP [Bacteroidales bacterium]|nr:RIP metalloprotease RseP [Candidatus Physcousia equi]